MYKGPTDPQTVATLNCLHEKMYHLFTWALMNRPSFSISTLDSGMQNLIA